MNKFLALFLCIYSYELAAQNELLSYQNSWDTSFSWFMPSPLASASQRKDYALQIQNFCDKIKNTTPHKTLSPKQVRVVFRQVHKVFLNKGYHSNQNLAETLANQTFDCVSATALFALIFEYIDTNYQIVETGNHVYILVGSTKGWVMLETTNKTLGFVQYPRDIDALQASYTGGKFAPQHITLKHCIDKGKGLLRRAAMLYACERVQHLSNLSALLK
jgi:hypothetical protein